MFDINVMIVLNIVLERPEIVAQYPNGIIFNSTIKLAIVGTASIWLNSNVNGGTLFLLKLWRPLTFTDNRQRFGHVYLCFYLWLKISLVFECGVLSQRRYKDAWNMKCGKIPTCLLLQNSLCLYTVAIRVVIWQAASVPS